MFLSKILRHIWMITQYIFEGKFFCYSLQMFGTADTFKCHINECFKINDKQKIKMSKKVNMLR